MANNSSLVQLPGYYEPISRPDGLLTDVWFRRLAQFQNSIATGITVVGSRGLTVAGSPVGPGGTVTLTNSGVTSLTLTQPDQGITITNTGVAETLDVSATFSLANDLAALEALSTTGFASRIGDEIWSLRTHTGTANRLTVTNGDGIAGDPTYDIAATYVGQSSITTLGTITTGTWSATAINLGHGGTNAALTASNGGIVYSTASAMAILAGTATANRVLLSGASTIPSWSTATYPSTAGASGNVVTSDGTNWVSLPLAAGGLSNGTTGSGAVVLQTTPTLITPIIGAATGTSLTTSSDLTTSAGNITATAGSLSIGLNGTSAASGTVGEIASTFAVTRANGSSTSTTAVIALRTYGGTQGSPSQTPSGQTIARFSGSSYSNSNTYADCTRIDSVTTEAQTSSARGAYMSFSTVNTGTNSIVERVRITETGQLKVQTVGVGLSIKEGSNAKMGTATLVAGTVTVSTTAVTASSRIFLTIQSLGTVTVPKAIAVTARTAGTSFVITSADNTDTSVIAYMLVEPS